MKPVVTFRAKPNDIERLRIISVVGMDIRRAADSAGLFEQASVSHRVVDGNVSLVSLRIFLPPPRRNCAGVLSSFRCFCPLTFIFLHERICFCPCLDAALVALATNRHEATGGLWVPVESTLWQIVSTATTKHQKGTSSSSRSSGIWSSGGGFISS